MSAWAWMSRSARAALSTRAFCCASSSSTSRVRVGGCVGAARHDVLRCEVRPQVARGIGEVRAPRADDDVVVVVRPELERDGLLIGDLLGLDLDAQLAHDVDERLTDALDGRGRLVVRDGLAVELVGDARLLEQLACHVQVLVVGRQGVPRRLPCGLLEGPHRGVHEGGLGVRGVRPVVELAESDLVDRVVERLAHLHVVERRLRRVEGDPLAVVRGHERERSRCPSRSTVAYWSEGTLLMQVVDLARVEARRPGSWARAGS